MDHLLRPEITHWLMQDGYVALFVLLALGILCLPIPEETLMVLSGYLIAKGTWPLIPTFLAAVGGSICGITLSYLLGLTAGHYLLEKYGYIIGLTKNKIKKVQQWFNKIGKWCLFIGYFIMGIRHFTGYLAGSTLLRFKIFALFAYSGALVWATTFISLGYFGSEQLDKLLKIINWDDIIILIIGMIILFIGLHLIGRRRRRRRNSKL